MPSTSGGSYKLGNGVRRMAGQEVKDMMKGKGFGSALLDGGIGGWSSYPSIKEYEHTTNAPPIRGRGLEKLGHKISGLSIIPPKKKKNNIKFEL
jgi:hypothetical protein